MNTLVKLLTDGIREKISTRKKLNRWFRFNAAAKHDVPWNEYDEDEILSEVDVNVNLPEGAMDKIDGLTDALAKSVEEITKPVKVVEVAPVKVDPAPILQESFDPRRDDVKSKPPSLVNWKAIALGTTLAVSGIIGYELGDSENTPPVDDPVVETVQEAEESPYPLLLYLQEQGQHLPENKQ